MHGVVCQSTELVMIQDTSVLKCSLRLSDKSIFYNEFRQQTVQRYELLLQKAHYRVLTTVTICHYSIGASRLLRYTAHFTPSTIHSPYYVAHLGVLWN